MRFLLLIIAIGAGFWILKHLLSSSRKKTPTNNNEQTTAMVRCEHCGLHIPQHEAIRHKNKFYCSDEHRKLHQD